MKDAGLASPQCSPGAFCSAPLKRRDLGALGHGCSPLAAVPSAELALDPAPPG